jgi:hypothetical protein
VTESGATLAVDVVKYVAGIRFWRCISIEFGEGMVSTVPRETMTAGSITF